MNLVALLYVGGGGALGAIARYALTVLLVDRGPALPPLGTLASNLAGCFIMGIVLQWLAEADWLAGTAVVNEHYRLLFAVGFCGSFTTLSALVYELSSMVGASQLLAAGGYLLASVGGGFLCFFAGIAAARLLLASG